LTQTKNIATFVGCVGKDEFGKTLEKAILDDGVEPAYLYDDEAPTGTCACLIVKHERYGAKKKTLLQTLYR
jgi:adenosine kinase